MRERIKDKGRLEHILKSINILLEYKDKFRLSHPEIEWDATEGMRHVLVHGYYTIKPEQVWQTIEDDIPQLKPQIERLIKEEEG